MNRKELTSALAVMTDIPQKDCDRILSAFINITTNTLKRGDKVMIMGFGTFKAKPVAARIRRNPRNDELMTLPPCVKPVFSPGKYLTESLNLDT